MDVMTELRRYFHDLIGVRVRTSSGTEYVGRVIFLDDDLGEIHPCPRHPRAAAIPRYKVRVADIVEVGPAPKKWDAEGEDRSAAEWRALVGPQPAVFRTTATKS